MHILENYKTFKVKGPKGKLYFLRMNQGINSLNI